MNRSDFDLWLLGAAPAAGLASAAGVSIPVELRAGRFFAVPRTLDGRTFACWLDTNGSGFIFASAVKNFGLSSYSAGGAPTAELPRFAEGRGIPPLAVGTTLAVFIPSPADRADPILSGFDAQLGATWFSQRAWRFDFRRGSLTMLAAPIASPAGTAITFEHGYPSLAVRIADDPGELLMSFDTGGIGCRAGTVARRHRPRHEFRPARDVRPVAASSSGVERCA